MRDTNTQKALDRKELEIKALQTGDFLELEEDSIEDYYDYDYLNSY
jgi:hypothetical protein